MLDGDGALLTGAEFTLYPNPGTDPVDPGFVAAKNEQGEDIDGLFSITGLQPGNYLLKETKAPGGKVLLAQAIKVSVAMDGKITISTTPRSPQVKLKSEGQGKYTIEITATSAVALPFAGGPKALLVALGAGVFVAALAATLCRRHRQSGVGVA